MSKFFDKFKMEEWNLGICNQDFLQLFANVEAGGTLCLDVRWMKHKHKNSFYADPFIYSVDTSKVQILAEEYFYSKSKGVISLLELNRTSASLEHKRVVLEETCHLSYPYYDEADKTISPESFRNHNWAKYDFDGHSVANKRLVTDFPLIDATPVEHKGMWYIFATNQPRALDELLIYYSSKKEGPYQPHPLNPVKRDIKTSRCGGAFFSFKGDLYRPVQDSTHRYGETMHIMKVTDLSPSSFAEELYCHISITTPDRYSLGFHTLNFKDNFIVVDGFRKNFRPLYVIYLAKIRPILIRLFNGKH